MTEKNISKYVGRRIRYYRELANMTQRDLGLKVGVKHNTISLYEKGTNRPSQNILFAIAKVLNVNINDLFPSTKNSLTIKEDSVAYLVDVEKTALIPVIGRISCGNGILAYEEVDGGR